MAGCQAHSYSVEPRHKKPEHYSSCPACKKAWDGHLRRNRWKNSERKVSKKLGTTRNPGSGASTPDNPGDSVRRGLVGEFFSHHEHRQRKNWDIAGWWREVRAEAPRGYPLLTVAKPDHPGVLAIVDFDQLTDLLKELSELRKDLAAGFRPSNGLAPHPATSEN